MQNIENLSCLHFEEKISSAKKSGHPIVVEVLKHSKSNSIDMLYISRIFRNAFEVQEVVKKLWITRLTYFIRKNKLLYYRKANSNQPINHDFYPINRITV